MTVVGAEMLVADDKGAEMMAVAVTGVMSKGAEMKSKGEEMSSSTAFRSALRLPWPRSSLGEIGIAGVAGKTGETQHRPRGCATSFQAGWPRA